MGQSHQYTTPSVFEITATINDQVINDVQSFVVYRCPIIKTASFAILKLSLKLTNYLILQDSLRNNELPIIPINIYEIDSDKRDKGEMGTHIHHFCTKNYVVLQTTTIEPFQIDAAYISCILYLVNPIFHYLNSNNSFNKILENITANDAIVQFESFLDSNYETAAFDFQHIGNDYALNTYTYEQILARVSNDLMVPSTLIQTYKPFNTFAFYFFDDFRLDCNTAADITNYYINIGNKDYFKQRDITDDNYIDVTAELTMVSTHNVIDSFNELLQKNASLMIEGSNINIETAKATGTVDVPAVKSEIVEDTISTGRTIKSIFTTVSEKVKQPTERTIIYASDDITNASERYKKVSEQLRNTIHSIDTYAIKNCMFDIFQFGLIYNLQLYNKSSFVFTPLSIINIFSRDAGKHPIIRHNSKIQFIKFKDNPA